MSTAAIMPKVRLAVVVMVKSDWLRAEYDKDWHPAQPVHRTLSQAAEGQRVGESRGGIFT
jgi:hypothetical protein